METHDQINTVCACAVCGQPATADAVFCGECQELVEALRRKKHGQALDSPDPPPEVGEESSELPDVLDAVRYRTRDRDNNAWYVSVSEMHGRPVEIFASTAFDRDHHLQSRISNLTTITRLISLILRNVFMGEKLSLEKILTQLLRSSRQPSDLPVILAGILGNYHENYQRLLEKETVSK